jgi:hypothetical protein
MHRLIKLAPLLCVFGCFGSKDSVLFDGDSPSALGGRAAGGSAGAQSGTGSGGSGGAAINQAGTPGGGTEPAPPGGGGGTAGSGQDTGGSGGQGVPVVIDDCSMLDQAVANEAEDRCYRVNHQNLSFNDAQRACREAGGNLVSIGSEAENEFVAELHDGEHWLGATDGRDDMSPGVGPYVWLNGEEWLYSDWEDGQPNAYETDCPVDQDDADCFEHCAFQSDEGDWLDRSCWHTIVSVCEWEVVKPEGGAGGAGGEGGAR